MVAELDAGGHRQRAAMQRVHAVGVDVARQVRRAADAADDADLMRLQARARTSLFAARRARRNRRSRDTNRDGSGRGKCPWLIGRASG